MSETTHLNYLLLENVCRVCCRSDLGVHLASFEELSAIKSLSLEMYFPRLDPMYFCIFCSALLRKAVKFVKQCLKAQEIYQSIKTEKNPSQQNEFNKLSVRNLDPICLRHDLLETELKDESVTCNDIEVKDEEWGDAQFDDPICYDGEDDEPLTLSEESEKKTPSYRNEFNKLSVKSLDPICLRPDSMETELKDGIVTCDDIEVKDEECSDTQVDDPIIDDDDVPLTMFMSEDSQTQNSKHDKHQNQRKKGKLKVQHNQSESTEITNESDHATKNEKVASGSVSPFSKRMVRETKQYLVIKLTKEQVSQEIRDNLKSDKFTQARYKCEKCAKDFNFEDVLRNHMEKHTGKSGHLLCDLCEQFFPTPVSLRGHIKSHTTRYKCKLCSIVKRCRQHLLEHYTLSHSPDSVKYTCDQCTFVTNKRTVIQRHIRTHVQNKGHVCDMCGKICKTIETLRVHRIRHDSTKQFGCNMCNRRFVFDSQLSRHVRETHVRLDNYCVECNLVFTSKVTLHNHFKKAKRHRETSAFVCQSCDSKFDRRSQLTAHMVSDHGAAPVMYHCDTCPKKYTSKETLRSHIRRVHNKIVLQQCHACDQCEKIFTEKHSLTRHLRTHAGARRRKQQTITKKPDNDSET